MKIQNKEGSAFLVIIIAVVVALFAGLGFVLWQNFLQPKTDQGSQTQKPTEEAPAPTTNIFTIDSATISTPKSWTEMTSTGTKANATQLAATTFLPGEKLRTIYGDGTEYFYVTVAVYSNDNNLSPKDWLTDDAGSSFGGLGIVANSDTESTDNINNYTAYYRHVSNDAYQEVHYVLSSGNKIVHLHARTYEPSDDLPGIGDFRKFESDIANIANSISIK